MSSTKVLNEAASPVFCQRVAFMAIRAAHLVATEPPDTDGHAYRVAYAQHIFRGDEKALLLTLHVLSADEGIIQALEEGNHENVTDDAIAQALANIWDARARALTAVSSEFNQVRSLMAEAHQIVEQARKQADDPV